jgi:hypothetical protein
MAVRRSSQRTVAPTIKPTDHRVKPLVGGSVAVAQDPAHVVEHVDQVRVVNIGRVQISEKLA